MGQTVSSSTSYSVPQAEIYTLANILATCVNSSGSTSTPCQNLFALTGSPNDILSAVVNLGKNPGGYSASAIYALATSTGPFQPTLAAAPSTFAVALTAPSVPSFYLTATPGYLTTAAESGHPDSQLIRESAGLPLQLYLVRRLSW